MRRLLHTGSSFGSVAGMTRPLAAAVILLLLAACGGDDPAPSASDSTTTTTETTTTLAPSTTEATTTSEATTTTVETDWLSLVKAETVLPEHVEAVDVDPTVMRVRTTLGYAPEDATRRGMAAEICMAAQAAGWDSHIEVWAGRAGILAWTGSNLQGCAGYQ